MGERSVLCSKDKDLKQAMVGYYIDMNAKEKDRVMVKLNILGNIGVKRNAKDAITSFSDDTIGMKLILGQTLAGDSSDGYGGLKGFGIGSAADLLEPLETVEECCIAVAGQYAKKFPKGIKYTDWKGQPQERTWQELCIQHCQLAYHERGSKDTGNPMSRYFAGEPIIYSHGSLKV
jgi:5'-3' exonuclease